MLVFFFRLLSKLSLPALHRLGSALGLDRRVGSFGGRMPFPAVGVEYGEQLRREAVPATTGAPGRA